MATTRSTSVDREVDYPSSDGKPMAETDVHRRNMTDLIETLDVRYAADPMVYVSGNLLIFYERGNKRRHVSPDVFLVRGVPKRERLNYLLWQEGRGPDLVIELTSKSTRKEDLTRKMTLYRDTLRVGEYVLFDPYEDYLRPSLQGYRLVGDRYEPMVLVEGRLPSEVLGLHLGREGSQLRLYDPERGQVLSTPREAAAETEAARQRAADAEAARRRAEAENEALRRELEALRRRSPGKS
jgi:Uma2 family endonuclease